MQSVTDINGTDTNLVTAEALREMTITKEDLIARQKANILDDLMSSMVKVATQHGANSYTANVNAQFDPTLLQDIVAQLTTLGYTVTTENKSTEKMGNILQVVISW